MAVSGPGIGRGGAPSCRGRGARQCKEGAMRPSVNIRHSLVEARVTERRRRTVVLLSSSVCLLPLSCESRQRDRAFIGHNNYYPLSIQSLALISNKLFHGRSAKTSWIRVNDRLSANSSRHVPSPSQAGDFRTPGVVGVLQDLGGICGGLQRSRRQGRSCLQIF